jgi:hypothetical protein
MRIASSSTRVLAGFCIGPRFWPALSMAGFHVGAPSATDGLPHAYAEPSHRQGPAQFRGFRTDGVLRLRRNGTTLQSWVLSDFSDAGGYETRREMHGTQVTDLQIGKRRRASNLRNGLGGCGLWLFWVGSLNEFEGWFLGRVPLDHLPAANFTIDAAAVSNGQFGITHEVQRSAVPTDKVIAKGECWSARRSMICAHDMCLGGRLALRRRPLPREHELPARTGDPTRIGSSDSRRPWVRPDTLGPTEPFRSNGTIDADLTVQVCALPFQCGRTVLGVFSSWACDPPSGVWGCLDHLQEWRHSVLMCFETRMTRATVRRTACCAPARASAGPIVSHWDSRCHRFAMVLACASVTAGDSGGCNDQTPP